MLITDFKMSVKDFKNVSCTAPCGMYGVLLENKLIPDPFYGTNDKSLTALSYEDCVFEGEFALSAYELNREFAELVFFGLDTICDIYLNGKKIDSVMNMHRSYKYDVRELLAEGKNTLKLYFHSPVRYYQAMNERHPIYTNDDSIQGAAHLRKALFMSGWDWAPELPDMGIFRPIELRCYDCDALDEIFIRQSHGDGKVTLSVSATTKHASDCEIFAEVDGKRVKLAGGEGPGQPVNKKCLHLD